MAETVRMTRSVCPVCLKNIPASLIRDGDGQIKMKKTCPQHGDFSVTVWQGLVDFDSWISGAEPLPGDGGSACPDNCGICKSHGAETCCALLEVTNRCNLRCRFCFARGGESADEPTTEELKRSIEDITEKCGKPTLILSGGEPTMRDDLPELAAHAKRAGCAYVQLNTNGVRLAEDEEYVRRLADAGFDFVFLQFDGTNDEIYKELRGMPLLDTKLRAIELCGKYRIGVTLVPTVVKGVNSGNLGELVRLAAKLCPAVRGVHFQPVSYFGRFPDVPQDDDRYTLDMLMADLSDQAKIPIGSFMPSRCDHPLCGFHASFMLLPDGRMKPLSSIARSSKSRSCAGENREYIARRWRRTDGDDSEGADFSESMDFDTFLLYARSHSLTLSSMAFQDAMNLNIERLKSCSLHVYENGAVKPFCAKYLSPWEGK